MSKLLLTTAKGKQHAVKLVPASSSQRPNEVQMRELDQVNRRLSPEILADLSARKLMVAPTEISLLLSRLKSVTDATITIGE